MNAVEQIEDVAADQAAARQLFAALDQVHLVAIHPATGMTIGHDFGDDVEAAVAWAMGQNAAGRGVYWTVNRVRPGVHKKPAKDDIQAARFVHADIDPPKDGTSFERDGLLAALADLPTPPSFIIDSGNGLQAFWRLDDDCANLAAIEAINRQVQDFYGADACWNIDRLMRVPGTVNFPSKVKAARGRVARPATWVEPDDGVVYSAEELRSAFPVVATDAGSKPRAPEKVSRTPFAILSPDDLRPQPPEGLRRLICEQDPDGRYGGDRSKQVIGCARSMIELGYTDTEIFGIVLNPANAVSEHCLDHADPRRAAQRAIKAARAGAGIPDPEGVQIKLKTQYAVEGSAAIPATGEPAWMRNIGGGPIPEYIETVLKGSARRQPELAIGSALAAFGTLAGRRYVGSTGLHTNLFSILLLESGAGKDATLKAPERLFTAAGFNTLAGPNKIASDEGVVSALARSPVTLFPIDELHDIVSQIVDSKSGGHMKAVGPRLAELYSLAGGNWRGTAYAQREPVPIVHPHVCVLGVTPRSSLFGSVISPDAFKSGFLTRFLIFEGNPVARRNRDFSGPPVFSRNLIETAKAMRGGQIDIGCAIVPKYKLVQKDAAAQTALIEFEDHCDDLVEKAHFSGNEALAAIHRRTPEHAEKIAMIRAITEKPAKPMISQEAMLWAIDLASAKRDILIDLLENDAAESQIDRAIKKAEKLLLRAGPAGLSRTDLYEAKRKLEGWAQANFYNQLADAPNVVFEDRTTGGAKERRFYHRSFVQ